MDKLPLLDLDFRTTYVEGNVLYTPSKGSLVTRAVMGTGVVGNAKAPTITKIGASFDGGDVAQLGANLIDFNVPRTIIVRGRFVPAGVNYETIMSNEGTATTNYFAWWMTNQSPGYSFLAMTHAGGGYLQLNCLIPLYRPSTLALCLDGTGTATGAHAFSNGVEDTTYKSGSVTQTVTHGAYPLVGGSYTGAGGILSRDHLLAGTSIRRFQIYPFALTPTQVRAIHEKFEREGEA